MRCRWSLRVWRNCSISCAPARSPRAVRARYSRRCSRAAGIREGRILWLLGLKNALVPVVQIAGMSLPYVISGALVTEVIFSWPGMGRLTYNAILARDYPVVLGATLLTATMVVLGNLLADIGHAAADPRVRKRLIENAAP